MKKGKITSMKYLLDKYYKKTKGQYPFFKYCPEKYKDYYINKYSSDILGYDYNYLNPKTFNEKIRWLIYNEKLSLKSILTDKIKVKAYITENIGMGHIAQIYGIWNNFKEIDFSYLPKKFVIKINDSWEKNIFIYNKEKIKEKIKDLEKIVTYLVRNNYLQFALEPQYKNIDRKIFIEQMIRNIKFSIDIQIHCFNEAPQMIEVLKADKSSEFYDTDWKILPYTYKGAELKSEIKKPLFLEEMLEYAKILSKGFSYVRIDFACTDERVIIWEMTFTPFAGLIPFSNKKFDVELGNLLKI